MHKIYLFIELLHTASPQGVLAEIKALDIPRCEIAAAVHLAEAKLVAQLNCASYEDGARAILEKIAPVEGVVQTNLVAAVRPVH